MKVIQATFVAIFGLMGAMTAAASDAVAPAVDADADADGAVVDEEEQRRLQDCWSKAKALWHPQYEAGWSAGYCRETIDCNSPGYSSQLACCKGAYAGQISGYCLSQLPNPPTTRPTKVGGLDVWYPQYELAWDQAYCTNRGPLPSGRPTYKTMLACCKGAYGGQMSGMCLSMLPNPPTTAPTNSAREAPFFYPRYEDSWSDSGCSNKLPLPFRIGDRPTYKTQLACCKAAYGGQMSGACLSELPNPPTTSPTGSGGYPFYYPDYETPWTEATCKNSRPLPFTPGGRPTYKTMLACCKAAYGGQMSGACLAALPNPPTSSPTKAGGLDVWYPSYSGDWSTGTCINDRPLPSGRVTYTSRTACCSGAYGGQSSHACMCDVNSCYSCKCDNAKTLCPALKCP